jgi:hypothetical protein
MILPNGYSPARLRPEILCDLVAIPSVSSLSNVPVINYALQFLDGWRVDRYPYTDPNGVAKLDTVAMTRPAREAELAFVCDTDTVPFEPGWGSRINLANTFRSRICASASTTCSQPSTASADRALIPDLLRWLGQEKRQRQCE